ncbi:enoyl-CoA hydratase/isomerase family protein [Agrobacterium arsenijevicii]|uniref:enoyl-CoA hydratase/isomerase family protein n=1 Tax=Agrobacterium arsenijevicii TaxID=1585697 RepID=UPI0005D437DB
MINLSEHSGPSNFVLAEVDGALGRIHLNRPDALNSLNHDMVLQIADDIETLESNPSVKTLVVTGEGRGLCAGGDIKWVWRQGQDNSQSALAFWRDEYTLNARIAAARKPWVAIMDGICMGGGAGLSVHGSHRVVTERTRFAMPETGIGFFPDVGMTWALSQSKNRLGYWIGLTGSTISASDTIAAGLADVMVASETIPQMLEELAAGRNADSVLSDLSVEPGPSRLGQQSEFIAEIFAAATIDEVLRKLEASGSQFANETLEQLLRQSPTSLVMTWDLLNAAAMSSGLEECLAREYAGCGLIVRLPDFYEGVRAAVIDKDKSPRWKPARLIDVDRHALENAVKSGASQLSLAGVL